MLPAGGWGDAGGAAGPEGGRRRGVAGPDGDGRHHRTARVAGIAGLLVPIVWAAIVLLELSQGQLSHSLVSRPERLFGALDSRWFAVLAAAGAALLVLEVAVVGGVLVGAERRRVARAAFAVAAIAAASRYGVTILAPDPHLYGVSQARGLAALVLFASLPVALALIGAALGGRSCSLAWLAAALAVPAIWVAAEWTIWSARVGALQPQLWAVEPVEAFLVAWCAIAGLWFLGLQDWLASRLSRLSLPSIPGPGRKASVAFALVAVTGLLVAALPSADVVAPAIRAQLAGRTQVETIRVGDIDRTFRVYRPVEMAAHPGLVFILHGVFGSGFIMEASTGFDAEADRLGWIVAYPDGVADGWDAFGSGPDWGSHPGADDVAFIAAAIDRLEATDAVDPARVYVSGLSRGAMMSYRLGCELSGRVAAIAPVSGNMATADGRADVPCNLARPVSVLAIHGTADNMIPIDGGKTDIPFSPFTDVMARWRALDSCSGPAAVAVDGASTTTGWSCKAGSTVAMRVVEGGWHTWPVKSTSPAPSSPDDFDASRLIADFFVAHPLVAGG
jgi:polyhydroxybutyrate depolymerase